MPAHIRDLGQTFTARPQTPSGARPQSTRGEAWTTLLVLLVILGMHTGISIAPQGKMLMPFALSFGAASLLGLWRLKEIDRFAINWFLSLIALTLALALATSLGDDQLPARLSSGAMLIYSVVIGYGFFLGVVSLKPSAAGKLFGWLAVALLVGAALEVVGILKPASDAFRQAVNSWRPLYQADIRDIVIYGGLRPKVFSQEPSVLGIDLSLSIVLWALSAKINVRRILAAIAMSVTGFFLIRSATIIVAPAVVILYYIINAAPSALRGRFALFLAGGIFTALFMMPDALQTANTLTGGSGYTLSGSYFGRQIAPKLVVEHVLAKRPVFGMGVGGVEAVRPQILDVYGNEGSGYYTSYQFYRNVNGTKEYINTDLHYLLTNVFWEFILSYGALGSVIVGLFCLSFFRHLGMLEPVFMVSTSLLFFQTFGGVNGPYPWIVMFGFGALARAPRGQVVETAGAVLRGFPRISPRLDAHRAASYRGGAHNPLKGPPH